MLTDLQIKLFVVWFLPRDGRCSSNDNRGRRMQGGMKKITIFDQYLALCRKWCKIDDRSIVTMEGE